MKSDRHFWFIWIWGFLNNSTIEFLNHTQTDIKILCYLVHQQVVSKNMILGWRGKKKIKMFSKYKSPCNENQLDALFIFSLFRQSTSACFEHVCSPSSGGILFIYNNWYVLCFSVDCLQPNPSKRQSTEKHNTY